MRNLGSPFQSGTLSSLILGIAATAVLIYFYLTAEIRKPAYLVIIFVGVAMTIKMYFKYQKLKAQRGLEMIGDDE